MTLEYFLVKGIIFELIVIAILITINDIIRRLKE